ncbi:hypothetical protein FRX31_006807, partial [Thalictrum thalictroides]
MDLGPDRDHIIQTWNLDIGVKERTRKQCTWEKPEQGDHALNTDGTLVGGLGGWSAVIRDHEGGVLHARAGKSRYKSIAMIELEGLNQGVRLAREKGITRLKAQTDSTNVVSFMNQNSTPPWQAYHMLQSL